MQPLYLNTTVRQGLSCGLRPGGDQLTLMALNRLQPQRDQDLLDVGCGNGGGLKVLRQQGYSHLLGMERNERLAAEARLQGFAVGCADMASLPVQSGSVDVLFCECAWNLAQKERALAEFFRVLRPGGHLVLSDIFVHRRCDAGQAWPKQSCFFQADTLDAVQRMVLAAGFSQKCLEDVSHLLRQTAAEFVFAHGSLHAFWQAVMGNDQDAAAVCAAASASKPGLFLLIGAR